MLNPIKFEENIMQRNQKILAAALIITSLALAVPGGRADDQDKRASRATDQKASECKASDIIGKQVKNTHDEDLGKVQELIVNMDSGDVPYAIIAHGGALGVGRTKTAVRLDALKCSSDGKAFILSATKDQLRAASKTASGHWTSVASAEWAKSVDGFYGEPASARDRFGRDRRSSRTTDQFKTSEFQASEIIGKQVKNTQDEDLGKLQEFIVNLDSGDVPYAIIAHGGALGVGRTKTAVPFDSLRCSSDGKTLMLSATKEQLQAASKTASGQWASAADAEWAKSVDGFYGQPTFARERFDPERRFDRTTVRSRATDQKTSELKASQFKASELIGKEVRNTQDESLGKIQELIVNLDSGDVPYAIIAHGGALGVGRTKTAVPFDSVKCSSDGKTLMLSATKEQLQAASKTPSGQWASAADAEWAKSVDGFYGQPSFAHGRFGRDNPLDTTDRRLFVREPPQKGAELLMTPADSALCEKVCESIENVQVSVQNGIVKLNGTVESEAAKQNIESRVKSVSGVQRVDNNLKVRNR
jgi:sporulation protein YlmC with PRC-barrel domain